MLAAQKIRNQCNRVVGYSVCSTPVWTDNGEMWLLERLAGQVSVLFDVGANVGDWAQCALRSLGSVSKAVLFEPSTPVCSALRQRYATSAVVDVIQAAVGCSVGSLDFFESADSSEASSIWACGVKAHSSYAVNATTVDREFARLGAKRLDLLKVDTEGNDFFVLRGAEELLRHQAVGVLQFEYGSGWIASGSTLYRAVSHLSSFGYTVFILKPSRLERFSTTSLGEYFSYSNFVAVSPEYLRLLSPFVC